MSNVTIGIDVQSAKNCPYAVLNDQTEVMDNGWLDIHALKESCLNLARRYPLASYGIDAPRMPLAEPRKFYWSKGNWRNRRSSEKGFGRHCETVIAAYQLARPQWTPTVDQAPEWMRNGFLMFEILASYGNCYEVFPSASYKMLQNERSVEVKLSFSGFAAGPKDMLDSIIAAVTVREYLLGRGSSVGGGDGKGEIILPAKLRETIPGVLSWPDNL